jgi:hypothetical protein
MKMNKALSFWHDRIGRYLKNSPLDMNESYSAVIPHRTKNKGVHPMRIGALEAFYIASMKTSYLIGRVELRDSDNIKFIGTENTSARKFIAQWLLTEATAPFMIGVIGKGSALESFALSHHIVQSVFCEAGAGFKFNLQIVREANKKISHLPWKKVASAIHQYESLRHAEPHKLEDERRKMQKILAKEPDLRTILPQLKVLPHSGEYTILSWLNIGE